MSRHDLWRAQEDMAQDAQAHHLLLLGLAREHKRIIDLISDISIAKMPQDRFRRTVARVYSTAMDEFWKQTPTELAKAQRMHWEVQENDDNR